MQIRMQNAEKLATDQIHDFLRVSREIEFVGQSRKEVYGWVERTLVVQEYAGQSKSGRGSIRAYMSKVSGLSLPQLARLIRQYRETGMVALKPYRRRQFPSKYSSSDVALLAEVDRAHERLSGPATRHILQRAHEQFGQTEYAHLAE